MVLLDDNFASIVAAVKEGRVIYDNIRKFVRYILTTNSSELWIMTLSMFLGMPLALLPLQILLINLVTDGLPALALGVEPAERNAMRRPPHKPNESIFARGLGWHILWVGLFMGIGTIAIGYFYWSSNNPKWQTMIFTTVTFTQMAHVLAIRSERDPLWYVGFFSNQWLLAAVIFTSIIQLTVVYLPFLQGVFKTQSLAFVDLAISIGLSAVIFHLVEFEKIVRLKRSDKN
jgi:Ca2+-transporting ATPase